VSAAYEADNTMSTSTYCMDVTRALHFLGTDHRDSLRKSLRRLASTTVSYGSLSTRRYEDVQLLVSWLESTNGEDVIRYSLPEPICILMRDQARYAYVELAAMATFKCKYSSRLYRILALAMAQKKWSPTDTNRMTISATPDEIADWVSFPRKADGSLAYGKMKERFLSHLMPESNEGKSDFDAIRRFHVSVNEIRKPGRGREVAQIDFEITLRAPSHRVVKAPFEQKKGVRIGGADTATYRVNSPLWRKAEEQFRHQIGMRSECFDLWQLALEEAISGEALTIGFHDADFRGERLLEACKVHGADYAAWGLLSEEAENPDLIDYRRSDDTRRAASRKTEAAEQARFARLGKTRKPDVVERASPTIAPAAQEVGRSSLGGVKEIIFPIDEALNLQMVDDLVIPAIINCPFAGEKAVELTIRHWDGSGFVNSALGPFHVTQDDLDMIIRRIDLHMDGEVEFVR
jgi:hypothetical protein